MIFYKRTKVLLNPKYSSVERIFIRTFWTNIKDRLTLISASQLHCMEHHSVVTTFWALFINQSPIGSTLGNQ